MVADKCGLKKTPTITENDLEPSLPFQSFRHTNLQKLLYNLKQSTILEVDLKNLSSCIKLNESRSLSVKQIEVEVGELVERMALLPGQRLKFDMVVGPICVVS
mmetsp:Transcript_25523/g.19291  ORF Transcript_25523/g.19291 Transcript_25523/m.19291 type:complete len:103 (+) Transcript_25523:841-1149(+)